MTQNRSSAVMQQRQATPPDELDYFPTPPWAVRALCEFLAGEMGPLDQLSVWEPACGEMHMVGPLAESFAEVRASDVFQYRDDHELADFLLVSTPIEARESTDLVITNPPFKSAREFILAGLRVARIGVAMLVRTSFAEGGRRYREIFDPMPPAFELVFAERVVMLKGRLIQAGAPDPFSDPPGKAASTATSYVWMIWLKREHPSQPDPSDTRKRWIAPSRQRLERAGDYPDYSHLFTAPAEGLFAEAEPT